MGQFSTVLHIYKKSQSEIVKELMNELRDHRTMSKLTKLDIDDNNYEDVLSKSVYSSSGLFYLITEQHGNWTTILELNVNIDPALYLYELTNSLSKRLDTYALSFHLHDSDVLYYNFDHQGNSIDGYNSFYQYFLTEAANKEEIISQRHNPNSFSKILPKTKKSEELYAILNEGYWNAFDKGDLDEDGVPNDDEYSIDEEDRFVRIGNYLEIYNIDEYPFADWHINLSKLNLSRCYLLNADR